MMRNLVMPAACLLGGSLVSLAFAAETVEKPNAHKPAKSAELRQLDQEEAWVFEPVLGRIDPFFDREATLKIEADIRLQQEQESKDQAGIKVNPNADILEYAAAEQTHIEALVVAKKYDEAIKVAEQALKRLEKRADLPEVQAAMTRIATSRDQADDALTRDEAQAQFDGLALKIEGILWSETGTRLAIISGEARALGVNERVKDCVIINIDTDRVDFRFHYKRKRFEFPRYVGEDSKTAAAK
jgi:tetratricopeptide (TPR) repeat protein